MISNQPDRTAVLDLPIRNPSSQSPYWHRLRPLLAVTHLDPGYATLRAHFPAGWNHLVRATALTDGVAAIAAPPGTDGAWQRDGVSPLLRSVARELLQFVEAEQGDLAADVVAQAAGAAEQLECYAETLEWKPVTLTPPVAGRPWLYCGPLRTWAMRSSRSQLSLLLVVPNADLQHEVHAIDNRMADFRSLVSRVLRQQATLVKAVVPTMHITDLMLAGGDTRSGHKNFAHFFPLEAINSSVDGAEFTIVFANVHAERLERCSLGLLDRLQADRKRCDVTEITRSSLRWFRCHDLAHFWRRETVAGRDSPGLGLTPFEQMLLEEAYADTLGLVLAAALAESPSLEQAYLAELLRYLSRRHEHFADSGAAALEAGWLLERGISFPPYDGWLSRALPHLEELVRCLHQTLWDSDLAELGTLRDALTAGLAFQRDIADAYQLIPTDLDYTVG